MGEDVLVTQARDLREKCKQCGGTKFEITVEPDTYIVELTEGQCSPTLDKGYRDITKMVCTACCRRVRIR